MTVGNAIFDYIKKYGVRLEGEITGPDELDFELSARWIWNAYFALKDEEGFNLSHIPCFTHSYTPNELTMLLVCGDFVYHFEWNEKEAVFVRYEQLEGVIFNA